MTVRISGAAIACLLAFGAALAANSANAQEQLYDRYGRPIVGGRIYDAPQPQQYYPPQQPQYYPQPQYSPYPVQRQSRYQRANYCATPYGACELPGPMFVGKGCSCSIPGVGKAQGQAIAQ